MASDLRTDLAALADEIKGFYESAAAPEAYTKGALRQVLYMAQFEIRALLDAHAPASEPVSPAGEGLSEEERQAIGECVCWNCHDRDVWSLVERILAARQPVGVERVEWGVRGDQDSPCPSREHAEKALARFAKGPYRVRGRSLIRRVVTEWEVVGDGE